MARKVRFTVYDKMEQDGIFDLNPANASARDHDGQSVYLGPVQFPKMLYHPTGETRQTVAPRPEQTIFGPMWTGEQKEIIWQMVKSEAEEESLLALGWHDHPAKAIAAGGGNAPSMGAESRIAQLERELALLKARNALPAPKVLTAEELREQELLAEISAAAAMPQGGLLGKAHAPAGGGKPAGLA